MINKDNKIICDWCGHKKGKFTLFSFGWLIVSYPNDNNDDDTMFDFCCWDHKKQFEKFNLTYFLKKGNKARII